MTIKTIGSITRKKITALVLVLAALFTMACPAFAASPPEIAPLHTDVQTARVMLSISSSGLATVTITATGKSTLVDTSAIVYLEKKNSVIWTRVDIGTTDDVWEYSTSARTFTKTFTHQLPSTGEYCATAEFTFTGSATEVITDTDKATY